MAIFFFYMFSFVFWSKGMGECLDTHFLRLNSEREKYRKKRTLIIYTELSCTTYHLLIQIAKRKSIICITKSICERIKREKRTSKIKHIVFATMISNYLCHLCIELFKNPMIYWFWFNGPLLQLQGSEL